MTTEYRLRKDFASQVSDFLAANMKQDDEASHAVAAALMSLANGDGAIVLDDGAIFPDTMTLEDFNADVSDALDHLEAGRTGDAITVLKGMADWIRERLPTE
jgi:hypothetical protein